MTEKNLIEKLNNCKNVNPDAQWLKSNRELFLAQISNSGANKLSAWELFYINIKSLAKAGSQPVFALGIFFLVLVASSIFTHRIFSEAKPNDSLYIARIISERARLNTILNPGERDRMAAKFATNHARDITTVLANPQFNTEENSVAVEKLNESFTKEIETAKNKIVRINERSAAQEQNISEPANQSSSTKIENNDDLISIAIKDTYITEKGIEINDTQTKTEPSATTTKSNPEPISNLATSTEVATDAANKYLEKTPEKTSDQIIKEAIELFERKDYESVINKLDQINNSLK